MSARVPSGPAGIAVVGASVGVGVERPLLHGVLHRYAFGLNFGTVSKLELGTFVPSSAVLERLVDELPETRSALRAAHVGAA